MMVDVDGVGKRTPGERIPLHDVTAPIACTAGDVPQRLAQIDRLKAFGPTIEWTEHGALLHFPHQPGIEAEVRAFVVEEQACCGFWGFDLTTEGDRVTLRWDAPPDARSLLDELL